MTTKVLILGSTGLIGHQVYNYLIKNTNYEILDISFRKKLNKNSYLIDAINEIELAECIEKISPNYIINCIGILINNSDLNPEKTIILNALLPHKLKNIADRINATLIHMSTDCVFSGLKGHSYIESDTKDGLDTYSKTKSLGEIINDRHLTLRTSVVGPELKVDGSELFHWFMGQTGTILGYTEVFWSGVTTLELAKAVHWAIDEKITGLYHVTNNSKISKNDLLNLFQKYTKKNIKIKPSNEKIFNKSFLDTRLLINYEIPSYETMISDMVELILTDKELYSQYRLKT